MAVNTSAGFRVFIGTTAAAANATQFAADTYVEIEDIEDAGEFGDESQSVQFKALKDSRVRKYKGSRDAGTMVLSCGRNHLDPGQIALDAAEATKFNYNFKVQAADAADGNDTNSVWYFKAMVMSKKASVGNNDAITKKVYNLGINSAVIEVPGEVNA